MTSRGLHPVQEKILKLLAGSDNESLTIREMQERLGLSTPSLVAYHIGQIEKKGFIKRNPSNPRDYQILKGAEEEFTYLNVYGLAHCGPSGTLLDGNPVDRFPISSRLVSCPVDQAFMVKAKGDSMEPKIYDNDYIIARKTQTADSGAVVVCVNNGEAMIKKMQRETDKIILVSLNTKYPPFLASAEFRIEGEVKGVISYRVGN